MLIQRTVPPRICEHCGRPYMDPWWGPSNPRRFCSRACGHAARMIPAATRFWAKVAGGAPDDCWCWIGYIEANGYGRFTIDGRRRWAHRVAWQVTYGPIPAGRFVCHRCDNPPCVNPAHLFLGTARENSADAVAKQRNSPPPLRAGTTNPKARLTEAQVREIRARVAAGETQTAAARAFGVSLSTVHFIKTGRNWRHLP